ncbi:hypothetical protein NDU88_007114 [Pleurodeles waltl]|uniref:CCHC-type domain-containing protein n=1 Tax=Pleurodeles waltl TaxID=8319 RepID=A0AAV7NV11_PLEWA|nr:hypothetical protein NDU88_007114 [Pleurodeles waltl]
MFVHYARVCGPTLSVERKHALLMHCLGGEGQEVLENLPELSVEESRNLNEYEVCIKKLDKHYVPRVSTIMERYYFGKREQGKDELVEEYITNSRKLAASCKFGTLVDERTRDQFVLKCCSDKIRELWLKDEPPLEEVIIVAKRVEHMLKCVKELNGNKVVSGECTKVEEVVCEVKVKEFGAEKKKEEFSKFKGECFRCGKVGHKANASNCPALNVICNGCGRKGHYFKCCRNKKKRCSNSNMLKEVMEVSQEAIFQVKTQIECGEHPSEIVRVEDVDLLMRFDSCSHLTIISKKSYDLISRRNSVLRKMDVCLVVMGDNR